MVSHFGHNHLEKHTRVVCNVCTEQYQQQAGLPLQTMVCLMHLTSLPCILQWHQGNLGFQGNTKGDALHRCVLMRPAFHSKQCVYGPHGTESTRPCVFGSDSHMSPPVMASQTQTSTTLKIIRGYVVMCAQNSVNSKGGY